MLGSGDTAACPPECSREHPAWHEKRGREMVRLEFVPVAGPESGAGLMNVTIAENRVQMTGKKVVSQLVRDAEPFKHRRLLAELPLDRILTETDGPFTKCGDRPARPGDVAITVEALARVRGLNPDVIAAVVRANLLTLVSTDTQ
jgi:hypothetical protein